MTNHPTITQTTTLHITTERTPPDEVIVNDQRYLPTDGPAVTPAAGDREPGSVGNSVATDDNLFELYEGSPTRRRPNLKLTSNPEQIRSSAPEPAPAGDVPLWDAMSTAYDDAIALGGGIGKGVAAELRCVADWLHDRALFEACVELRAEADRAEAS